MAPVAYSFDGLIDEVRIHEPRLDPAESVAASSARSSLRPRSSRAPGPAGRAFRPWPLRRLLHPLRYTEEWENPWRVGDAADVVVRFDETPKRLVFWRGTSYIPAWVTENGIWYTNEFYETQVPAMATSAEPMADKQARFSHARILESNDARAVVLWRYAPVSVNYELVYIDP